MPGPDAGDGARVLIVDDERQDRELLAVMLGPEGFSPSSAASGEEALAMVAQAPPDLILLDVIMPGMDGYEVARQIKGNPSTKGIPVIMLSALDDRSARMLGLSAGAEDFLSKPVDRAELCMRVRNLVRLKAYGDYHDKYSQMLEGEVGSRTVELVESERLYRSTFDAAPVGIVHVGLDGKWLRVNQRLCSLLGYSREELQSVAVQELVQADEARDEAESSRHMSEGTLDRYVVREKRYRHRDGSFVWARVNMSVHHDAKGQRQYFISVIEDITASRALEAQLRQAGKMDAIGQLAAGIAHDFNNLLSVIVGYSEMLVADLREADPMRIDLNEIRAAGVRAAELTRQLLAFSRQQVLKPQLVDLSQVVAGMERMLSRLLGADVELYTSGVPGLGRVLVDPGQMEQIIMNLSVNARDAMPNGGRLSIETAQICLDATFASEHVGVSAGPHILLTVRDTGVGMDKATLARMFEPFFTTKELGKGTGLGLATVFGIVRQSGGTIWVDSEPGKGTTFEIYFPADQSLATPAVSASIEPLVLHGSETILLVEDEERLRILARTILRKYGYDVLEAQNGGDAFLLCEQHVAPIHLLLTDVVMPRMNGPQLAERLRSFQPEMKVLYMSGYTDDAIVRRGIQDAAIEFIQKPITPKTLARKVRAVLDG